MILNYNKYLNEHVNICDYKKWSKYANLEKYKSYDNIFQSFDDHDKNYHRIYFPLQDINNDNWEIQVPTELSDYLGWNGYGIIDYIKGLVRDKDGRPIKIGKLLNRENELNLLKIYQQSKDNILKNVKDLYVVISRHPYDIVGISTNRNWTTCLDLDDKRYNKDHIHHLIDNLKDGYLVAYLIRKDDRNINNPISRVLIAPRHNQTFYPLIRQVYGIKLKEFENLVIKWTSMINDKMSVDKWNNHMTGIIVENNEIDPFGEEEWDEKDIDNIISNVTIYGYKQTAICDGVCEKAWGISNRPKIQLSDNPDDYMFLGDDDIVEYAPNYPRTFEGGVGKPLDRNHNKWCYRECERCNLFKDGDKPYPKDLSKGIYNIPK